MPLLFLLIFFLFLTRLSSKFETELSSSLQANRPGSTGEGKTFEKPGVGPFKANYYLDAGTA